MKARFAIGMTFLRKRFPKAKEITEYRIDDVCVTTSVKNGQIFRIEYVVSHEFMGQRLSETVVDTAIARCLSNEQLAQYA